jgi:hypothetical protein
MKCADQFVDCPLARNKAVNPMQIGKADAQASPWLGVFDPKRDDDFAGLASDGDFAADVFAFVATLGEDQKHRPAGVDSIGDLVVEWLSRLHVTRRDPTRDATALELADNIQGGDAIFSDVAYEQK